jgi:PAS domain S-box-containing protein
MLEAFIGRMPSLFLAALADLWYLWVSRGRRDVPSDESSAGIPTEVRSANDGGDAGGVHMSPEALLRLQRDLAIEIVSARTLEEIGKPLFGALFRIEGVDCGGIYVVDCARHTLDLVLHQNLSPAFFEREQTYSLDSAHAKLVLASKPVYRAVEVLPVAIRTSLESAGLRSITVLPLVHHRTVIGSLNLGSHSRDEFSVDLRNVLEGITAQIVGVLARLRSEQELREAYAGLEQRIVERTEHLELSEEKFKKVFESSPIPMALSDADNGEFFEVNGAFLRILGYERDEVIGRTSAALTLIFDSEKREQIKQTMERAGAVRNYETTVRAKGGAVLHGLFSGDVIQMGGRTVFLSTMVDVTSRVEAENERAKIEEQMWRTQNLESLGVLAGGIAHDFNNLLVGVIGNAELAAAQAEPGSALRNSIENVRNAGEHLSELTRQILTYAGKAEPKNEVMELSQLVKEMGTLLEASISRRVAITYSLRPDLPPVCGDATQLRQVIMNLISNAADAIGDGHGTVAISTSLGTVDDESNSPCIVLEVMDSSRYDRSQRRHRGSGHFRGAPRGPRGCSTRPHDAHDGRRGNAAPYARD